MKLQLSLEIQAFNEHKGVRDCSGRYGFKEVNITAAGHAVYKYVDKQADFKKKTKPPPQFFSKVCEQTLPLTQTAD